MCEQNYFQKSLSNFTLEAASGGAIRHLADLGLSAKQIREKLTFPTPFEVVKKILWQRLVDSGVVLLEEPGSGEQCGKPVYTVDHGKFGKTSFRMITPERKIAEKVNWSLLIFLSGKHVEAEWKNWPVSLRKNAR